MMIAARNAFLMSGAKLPYDAEVEYLESSGTQYTNTGVYAALSTSAEFVFSATDLSTSLAAFFGARNGAKSCQFALGRSPSSPYNGMIYFAFADYAAGYSISNIMGNTSAWHTVRLGQTWSIDSFNGSFPAGTFTASSSPLLVFAQYVSSSRISYSSSRFAYCKIWQGNTLVRDFISVRVGSGASAVGYLYDRVSGALFGNAGTGAFVIGPDK